MIRVDQELCTGCGACLEACAQGAIYLIDDKACIDSALCDGCGDCVEVCATDAILAGEQQRQAKALQRQANEPLRKRDNAELQKRTSIPWGTIALTLIDHLLQPGVVEAISGVLDRRERDRAPVRRSTRPLNIWPRGATPCEPRRRRRRLRGRGKE
jgi:ferredoxin